MLLKISLNTRYLDRQWWCYFLSLRIEFVNKKMGYKINSERENIVRSDLQNSSLFCAAPKTGKKNHRWLCWIRLDVSVSIVRLSCFRVDHSWWHLGIFVCLSTSSQLQILFRTRTIGCCLRRKFRAIGNAPISQISKSKIF